MSRDKSDWSWKPDKSEGQVYRFTGEKIHKKPHNRKKRNQAKKKLKNDGFYRSWEWLKLRYEVLKTYGAVCMLCGNTWDIVVDHIKPRSKYPELALDFDNMQVLCDRCNRGKSRDDFTDFRPKVPQEELSGAELSHWKTL